MRLPLFALLLCAGCLNFDSALETCRAEGRCEGGTCNVDGTCPGALTCVNATCVLVGATGGGSPTGGGSLTGGGASTGGGEATGGGAATGGGGTDEDGGLDAGAPDAGTDAGVRCTTASCANGCCDSAGQCITRNTAAACGRLGASCSVCGRGEICEVGECVGCKGCITGDRCLSGDVNAQCGVEGSACQECAVDAGSICIANACRTCTPIANSMAWSERMPTTSPTPRFGHVMAPLACRAVIFGGATNTSASVLNADTWVWNGDRWYLDDRSVAPPARIEGAMAPFNGGAILFGGRSASGVSRALGDTWRYTPGAGWVQLTVIGPTARFGHVMALDAVSNRVLMHGGTDALGVELRETWSFSNGAWNLINSASGPAVTRAAMAHDARNGGVVLYGGENATNDTWTLGALLGGNFWSAGTSGPIPRAGAAMSYAPQDQGVLLVGGENSTFGFESVYSGLGWQNRISPHGNLAGMSMVTLSNGTLLLFGGLNGNTSTLSSRTWSR